MPVPSKNLCLRKASVIGLAILLAACGGGGSGDSNSNVSAAGGTDSSGAGNQAGEFAPELVWNSLSASRTQRLWINRDTGDIPFTDNIFEISGSLSGPVGTTLTFSEQAGPVSLLCDRWTAFTENPDFTGPRIVTCTRQPGDPTSTNVTLQQIQRWPTQRDPARVVSGFLDRQEFFLNFEEVVPRLEENYFVGNAEAIPRPSF